LGSDELGDLVPLWTQSSGKSATFYLVPEPVFEKLASRFNRDTDAETFAACVGLLFSDVTSEPVVEVPAVWGKAEHGEDGNGTIARKLWGRHTRQFRAVALDSEGWPILLGKGTLSPVKKLDRSGACYLNDSMIKWAHPNIDAGETILLARTVVDDRPIKIPVTWELIQLLKDVPEVHAILEKRTKEASAQLLRLVQAGNELELLKRLGQLKMEDGELRPADRNVLSALRSNFPWCRELEERLGRIFVRELTEKIAVSGGLWGWGYLAIQHNQIGEKPCSWEEAKCFAFRLPLTSGANLVPFRRDPKGKVHPEAMARMDGDSDGDRVVVISDPEIVNLVRNHRLGFVAPHKPKKERHHSPLTSERMRSLAVTVISDAPLMGCLTLRQHGLLTAGLLEEAAWAGWLAQMSPMLIKWQVQYQGRDIRRVMWDEVRKGLPNPHWREMQARAKEMNTPRDLVDLHIAEPESLIDRTWNWMIAAVQEWDRANPHKPLSLPSVAKAAWRVRKDLKIGGHALRWRIEVVRTWGRYWAEHYGEPVDHSAIYRWAKEVGESATIDQLVAMLLWRPTTGRSGFALKWAVMGTRWEDVLGYRPEVAAYVLNRLSGGDPMAQLRVAQLVEAVLESEPEE
jgi:hypothetical protein